MNLIIVESPTKARTLSRFLGDGYKITSTMGHIRDLPQDRLGVDVEHDFTPDYINVKKKSDKIKELKSDSKNADTILLATDPDREGEAIAWHVMNLINSSEKRKAKSEKLQRIVFHEITERAINDALHHPRNIDMKLVDAQQARRVLDRLVGYKLSPLLWYKVRKGLSAGRVQSVALRLIVEREREIEAFMPEEYWLVEAELAQQLTGSSQLPATFLAKLIEKAGEKVEVKNKEQADGIVNDLANASYQVSDVKKKEVRRFPYPPFTTSTMQQTASNRFGWTAKRVMQIAQNLYEEGYISYHRTDSTNIATEAITAVRLFISNEWGEKYVPQQPRLYKTKSKVAQEAHEAIRPTNVAGKFPEELGREASRLYGLIWKRFVACQMVEAVYDQTSVDIKAVDYLLRASGSVVKFDGWQVVYAGLEDGRLKMEDGKDEKQDNRLPELAIGELLTLIKLLPQQKFTEPPPRFNEASLIKSLEEKGIGRPSTYAPTISTIIERRYVERIERRFHSTPLGKAVNDFLMANFSDILDYDFTAKMEDSLDSIANGEKPWVPTIREFYQPFNTKLSTVYKESKRVKIETEQIDEQCPDCGNPLVVRIGRYGKFIACSTYPKCKYTRQFIEKTGLTCPQCGGDVIMRKTKRGKQFYGCSNYPKCTFAAWKKEQIVKPINQPPELTRSETSG